MDYSVDRRNKARPLYYQSYLRYREFVGWIFHEDWMELGGDNIFWSIAFRERFYRKELEDGAK